MTHFTGAATFDAEGDRVVQRRLRTNPYIGLRDYDDDGFRPPEVDTDPDNVASLPTVTLTIEAFPPEAIVTLPDNVALIPTALINIAGGAPNVIVPNVAEIPAVDITITPNAPTVLVAEPDGRNPNAGLWSLWNGNPDASTYALPIAGSLSAAKVVNVWSDGEYRNLATHNTARADSNLSTGDAATPAKGIAMQWSDKKDVEWQKHVWYANNADTLGTARFEAAPENWVGAWWTLDGLDVMEGIFDGMVDYFMNTMTQAQRDRSFMRSNYNAITAEGFDPGDTLEDTSHPAWTRGAEASTSRPPDYTTSVKETWKGLYLQHVMDTVMPSGDAGDPLFNFVARARNAHDSDAATNARMLNLMYTNKVGVMVTSLDFEPRSEFQGGVSGAQGIYNACVLNGNTMGHTEPFGPGDTSSGTVVENTRVEANFSMLQYQYWMSLHSLHLGTSYVGWREVYCQLYDDTVISTALRDEWRAIVDFINKYAGYIPFPSSSPGAWLALREGNRFQGNYEFLMTQVVAGAGVRGAERWAGSNGTFFNFPNNDFVGPGCTEGAGNLDGSFEGNGQRQSVWAFRFNAGESLKLRLNDTFAGALDGADVRLNIHWLGESTTPGTFDVELFGQSLGSQATNNNLLWNIATFEDTAVTVAEDADGAHIVITPQTFRATFHMVELEKLSEGSPPPDPPDPTPGNITLNGVDEQFTTASLGTQIELFPPGADGDLLLSGLLYADDTSPTGWGGDSAWALPAPAQIYTAGFDIMTQVMHRVASSEPASYVFTTTDNDAQAGIMAAFTGVDTSNPLDVTFTLGSHYREQLNSDQITPAPITTVTDNAVVCIFVMCGFDSSATSYRTPAGYTKVGEVWRSNARLGLFTKEVATAGIEQAEAISVVNGTSLTDLVSWTLALRPAST